MSMSLGRDQVCNVKACISMYSVCLMQLVGKPGMEFEDIANLLLLVIIVYDGVSHEGSFF